MKDMSWLLVIAVMSCLVVLIKTQDLIALDPDPEEEEASLQLDYEPSEIFVPSDEWKEIRSNQAIPRGLHVRINMETGKKEARLYHPEEQSAKETEHEKLKEALKNIKNDMKEQDSQNIDKFRSIEEIRSEFEAVNTKVETEFDIISRLVEEFQQFKGEDGKIQESQENVELLSDLLINMEYYVHKYDNAIDFLTLKGIDRVLKPCLNASSSRIQQDAAFIIGSAAQSNPKVQIAFLEAGFVHELARKIGDATSVEVASKCVYALAAILRNFPEAQNLFFRSGGLQVLKQAFRENTDIVDKQQQAVKEVNSQSQLVMDKIRIKILTLIQDLWDERLHLDLESPDAMQRQQQYARSDFNNLFHTSGWCEVYQFPLLTASSQQPSHSLDHDRIEKLVTAMVKVKPLCGKQFRENTKLRERLQLISSQYRALARPGSGVEDEYFVEILDNILNVLNIVDSDSKDRTEL